VNREEKEIGLQKLNVGPCRWNRRRRSKAEGLGNQSEDNDRVKRETKKEK